MWYRRVITKPHRNPKILSSLKKGERGVIVSFHSLPVEDLSSLKNLGLGPGAYFVVLYRYPCFLLGVEGDRVALDRELASAIHVLPEGGKGSFMSKKGCKSLRRRWRWSM